jgi:GNAT superfamily N-acetyltransferase
MTDKAPVSLRLIRYDRNYQEPMLALHRGAVEGFALGMSREEDEADLRAVEEVYLRDGGEFLLGCAGDRLVAMGGFKRRSDGLAELRRMRIAGDLQGQGHGTVLLRELERRAWQLGIRTLCLETALRRPLTLEFYRKHGYRETDRGFYGAIETAQLRKTLLLEDDELAAQAGTPDPRHIERCGFNSEPKRGFVKYRRQFVAARFRSIDTP